MLFWPGTWITPVEQLPKVPAGCGTTLEVSNQRVIVRMPLLFIGSPTQFGKLRSTRPTFALMLLVGEMYSPVEKVIMLLALHPETTLSTNVGSELANALPLPKGSSTVGL